MLSAKGLCQVLLFPVHILVHVIKFYTVGIQSRKFKSQLRRAIFLLICRKTISLTPHDGSNLIPFGNSFLLNRLFKLKHGKTARRLNNLGARYDKNSFWIVEAPEKAKTDPIIVYLHGGGYFLQTMMQQVESAVATHQLLRKETKDRTSMLLLDYKLVGHGYTIPHQLYQLHETYSRLVKEGYTNIIFMGDSCGGHLALAYLQYLKRFGRKNDTVFPTKLVLVSPWTNLNPSKDEDKPGYSFYDNDQYDMLTYKGFRVPGFSEAIYGKCDLRDPMISPLSESSSSEDWSDIPTLKNKESDVFIVCGEDEAFRDQILEWMEVAMGVELFSKYKYGDSENKVLSKHIYLRENRHGSCNVHFYMEPWGVHDSLFFFESGLLSEVEKGKVAAANQIDDVQYFGIARLVEFLNDKI